MYCVYGNSSWYINGGALFGGGPLLGGSVIGGFTVDPKVFFSIQRVGAARERSIIIIIGTHTIWSKTYNSEKLPYGRR